MIQEAREGQLLPGVFPERTDPADQILGSLLQSLPHDLEHVLLRNPLQVQEAAEGLMQAAVLDLLVAPLAGPIHQRAEPELPVEAALRLPDDAQNGQAVLPTALAQPAAELLMEHREAFRRTEQ